MSKLIDVFVDWAKQKRRWPLLLILLVPIYFAFFQSYYKLEFNRTLGVRVFLWLSALTLVFAVVLFLVLSKRERVRYSRLMDQIRKGRRVSITEDLAWQTLTFDEGTGEQTTVTIVKELDLILRELNIHPVVIPRLAGAKPPQIPRDEFIIYGLASPSGLLFRSAVPLNEMAPRIIDRFSKAIPAGERTSESTVSSSLRVSRVFDIQSIIEMYIFEIPIFKDLAVEQRAPMVRMFLRHALMAMLVRDEKQEASSLARSIIDIGMVLAPTENLSLAKMCRAAAIILILSDEPPVDARQPLNVAKKFAPNDSSIIAMQAVLSLNMDRLPDARTLIHELQAVTKDQALLSWLQADYLKATQQSDEAIDAYETAIALEAAESNRQSLHINAAFAYARAKNLSPREQGDGIIRHLEDAIQSQEQPVYVYHALKGYGWALRGDANQFEAEFAKVARLVKNLDESLVAEAIAFVEHWKSKALLLLNQSSTVAESISRTIGSIEESQDLSNLKQLALASLELARIEGKPEPLATAERCLNRIIALDPSDGEAFKLRGFAYRLKIKGTSVSEDKVTFFEKARENLLKSIRLGHESPSSHSMLGALYETAGDKVNAAKHRKRWLELEPNDPAAIAYQALNIMGQTGDLAKAQAHLASIQGEPSMLGRMYHRIAQEAVNQLDEGESFLPSLEKIKECLLKAIDCGYKKAETYHLLASVLFDTSEFSEGIKYQRLALESNERDASGLTFLGELLVCNKEFEDAIDVFLKANKLDPEDIDLLKRQALAWQAACQLDEASAAYINWLKAEPTSPTANNNLAFILFDRGDHSGALQHWERALESRPDDGDSTAGKAAALHLLGRVDEARACYKQAVALNADFLNENTMRTTYSWSDKAVGAVREYIAELGGKKL